MTLPSWLRFLLSSITIIAAKAAASANHDQPSHREIRVINNSLTPISILTLSGILKTHKVVLPGSYFPLEANVGDVFTVEESPDAKSNLCLHDPCWRTSFTVSAGHQQEITIDQEFHAILMDTQIYARQVAEEALEECQQLTQEPQLTDCLVQAAALSLEEWDQEWDRYHQANQRVADLLEEYVCYDPNHSQQSTSQPIQTQLWESYDQRMHEVLVLHQQPSSQIHLIPHFIDPLECQAIHELSRQTGLQPATVQARGGHGPEFQSQERQAWEAAIHIPWNQPHHPITRLAQRIFQYANHALPLPFNHTISSHGQERMMAINYYGKGVETDEELLQRYDAHCDASCDGSLYHQGERIATMVMYCKVPQLGGHTHFPNANIHIEPQVGSALFFSYLDPKTNIMDAESFTKHTGCPVFEGHKQIVTQWIGMGSSSSTSQQSTQPNKLVEGNR
jgi:2OG-Fe(II) oxygenase superfamily